MWRFLIRIRVLPITIFMAALIVTVKIGGVADVVDVANPRLQVSQVSAQQPPAPQNEPQPLLPDTATPPAQPKSAPKGAADAAAAPPVPASPVTASTDPANDPTLFTQNEIDLLQQLADRRESLEKQSQEVSVRQGLLQAAEQRIDRKIQELQTLQAAIDELIKKHDAQEEAKVRSLVKIYENMKPKDAARIFEELDLDTLLLVAERMNERRLAPVMAQMDPAKAKDVTVKLSTLRSLPLPGVDLGG